MLQFPGAICWNLSIFISQTYRKNSLKTLFLQTNVKSQFLPFEKWNNSLVYHKWILSSDVFLRKIHVPMFNHMELHELWSQLGNLGCWAKQSLSEMTTWLLCSMTTNMALPIVVLKWSSGSLKGWSERAACWEDISAPCTAEIPPPQCSVRQPFESWDFSAESWDSLPENSPFEWKSREAEKGKGKEVERGGDFRLPVCLDFDCQDSNRHRA